MEADSHTCQRCHQPLVLDPSISNLTPSSHALITSALPSPSHSSPLPPDAKLAALPPSSRPSAEIWASSNGIHLPSPGRGVAESFVLLSDSVIPSEPSRFSTAATPSTDVPSLDRARKVNDNGVNGSGGEDNAGTSMRMGMGMMTENETLTANLHAILSSRTPISHPLCTECTTLLQAELQKELEELSRERDAYIEFQRGIIRNRETLGKHRPEGLGSVVRQGKAGTEENGLEAYDIEGTEEEWEALMTRKKDLDKEEERLKKALEEKEGELDVAREEAERVKREEAEMGKAEEEFLLSHAELSTELRHLDNSLTSAKTRLLLSQSLLSHLETTNVYNDAFQIGHVPLDPTAAGRGGLTVGTINGLRLGGRPVVDWEEINAAWGLVALCIDRIAVKVGCVFEGYKIMPLGSFSRIEEIPASKGSYELYASSDLSPARLLQNRRFNHALVSLLELLRQLVEFGRRKDRGWGVDNIEIRKDKISGHSIRLPGISAMQMPTLSSMSIMGLGSSSSGSNDKDKSGRDSDATAEETWTRACRAVLAVLKRVLVVESESDKNAVSAGAQAGN